MLILYFMRHAQSMANHLKILASQLDYPLSPKGFEDAKRIAGIFCKHHRIDRIITSPLKRATQTAQPFADYFKLEIMTDQRLIEQHIGRFTGMDWLEVKSEADYQHDKTKRWDWIPAGGGESYQMVGERIKAFLNSLESITGDLHILVVSHAISMRLIKALLENTLPLYPIDLAENGEIWETEFYRVGDVHEIRVVPTSEL